MKHEFKVGDKVKIPTQKTKRTLVGLKESLKYLRVDVNTKFLIVTKELHADDNVIAISNPNYPNGYISFYGQDDLELYVEEMTIPKVLKTGTLLSDILEVQDIDGAIYHINDKVVCMKNPGRPMTIRGFKWNGPKTNLLAITNSFRTNGIGIDKIELFIEKPVIDWFEEVKQRYPIGSLIKTATGNSFKGVLENYDSVKKYNEGHITTNVGKIFIALYDANLNKWAEILELPKVEETIEEIQPEPEFVLPEVWHIKVTPENIDIVQQYWRFKNPESSVKLDFTKYIGFTKWFNGFEEIRLGYGTIKNLQLTPTYSKDEVSYYNGVEITTEQFIEYVLPENLKPKVDTFVLPEKWCIEANQQEVIDYTNKINNVGFYNLKTAGMYKMFHFPKTNTGHMLSVIQEGYTKITFEQFQQYVLFNGLKIGDTIKATNGMFDSKIITDLQYINGQAVVFFGTKNTLWDAERILLKNVIKID